MTSFILGLTISAVVFIVFLAFMAAAHRIIFGRWW